MNVDRSRQERKELMPDASAAWGPEQSEESPSLSGIVPKIVYDLARRATVFTDAARRLMSIVASTLLRGGPELMAPLERWPTMSLKSTGGVISCRVARQAGLPTAIDDFITLRKAQGQAAYRFLQQSSET